MGEAKVADVITIQDLVDGRLDVKGMATFYNGPAGKKVPRRLAGDIETLEFYLDYLRGLQAVYEQPSGIVEVNGVQVKPVKVALKEALDAAVVGGGGLAATAVATVSPLTGAVARTQALKNSDVVSIKDFGTFADGADWTSAFHKAAITGKTIHLPDGKYGLRCEKFPCLGKDLIMTGDDGAEIILMAGSGSQAAFDVTDSKTVKFDNISFSTSDNIRNTLLYVSPTSYVKLLQGTRLRYEGPVVFIRSSGSTTQLPSVKKYGFECIAYNGNTSSNATASHFVLTDYPIYQSFFIGNTVNNFLHTYFYFGISNQTANGVEIRGINSAFIDKNIVTNDDSFWNLTPSGSYYTFFLGEGKEVVWTNNHVSGMKADTPNLSLYDSYLSYGKVTSQNNHYKNNANFNVANLNNWVLKAKSDSSDGFRTVKTFINNTYIIEDDWLVRIGKTSCTHKLMNTGYLDSGKVIMKGLVFDLHSITSSTPHGVSELFIDNMSVKVKKILDVPIFFELDAAVDTAILSITNSNFYASETVGSLSFIKSKYKIPFATLKLKNININIGDKNNTSEYILYGVQSKNTEISNITYNGGLRGVFYSCGLGNVIGNNNKMVSSNIVGVLPNNAYSEFIGTNDFKISYTSKLDFIYIPIYLNKDSGRTPKTSDTNYLVTIDVRSDTGVNSLQFLYTLNYSGSDYSVKFVGTDDLQKTALVPSTENHLTAVKSTASGLGSLKPTVRLRNETTFSFFEILGLPKKTLSFDISISSFEV